MSDVKKNKSEVGQTASSNPKTFSMPSLKDIVSGISEVESAQCDESLSKKVDLINEKDEKVKDNNSEEFLTGCDEFLQNLKLLETGVKANVSLKVTDKCHRMLSELKLIDEFSDYSLSDLVEALVSSFIQKNKTELKKKLSKRKSVF